MSLPALFLMLLVYSVYRGVKASDSEDENLCMWKDCRAQVSDTSPLVRACEPKGFSLKNRCCYRTENGSVFGIDLSNCHVKSLNDLDLAGKKNSTPGYDEHTLEMLLVDTNPFTDCADKSFDEMTNLYYLSLPSECSCPLGNEWDSVTKTSNETICSGDACRHSGVICPLNSHCEVQSRDVYWCVCEDGYFGYKCLRKGTFQMIPFVAGIVSTTAFVSGLVWLISRRKARKVD